MLFVRPSVSVCPPLVCVRRLAAAPLEPEGAPPRALSLSLIQPSTLARSRADGRGKCAQASGATYRGGGGSTTHCKHFCSVCQRRASHTQGGASLACVRSVAHNSAASPICFRWFCAPAPADTPHKQRSALTVRWHTNTMHNCKCGVCVCVSIRAECSFRLFFLFRILVH